MAAPCIGISRHHRNKSDMSCAKNTCSGGGGSSKARRRISFNNVFRRSSSATSNTAKSLQRTTAAQRSQVDGDCRNNPSSHSQGTDSTADSMVSGASDGIVVSSCAGPVPRTVSSSSVHRSPRRHSNASNIEGKPLARPRRSSLKKTSSYESTNSSDSTVQTDATGTENKTEQTQTKLKRETANTKNRRPSFRRRRSTTDIPSSSPSSAANQVLHSSHSSASLTANRRRRPSVQFDNCVSFATVPNMDDIIEQGGCETDLYYTDEEFGQMKHAVRQDARQIKEDRMNFLGDVTIDNNGNETNSNISGTNSHQRQDEDDLNDWGIEHHTCTKLARAARANRVNHVIQSVLREQETQCIDPDSGLLTEASVQSLARTSAMASQVARVQAQRRASDVERHCRRWSATAINTNGSANISDNDIGKKMKREEGKQRRHSSCEDVLPHHGDFREDESESDDDDDDDGSNSDSDALSVADASLDESASRVKSYTRRRRGSVSN